MDHGVGEGVALGIIGDGREVARIKLGLPLQKAKPLHLGAWSLQDAVDIQLHGVGASGDVDYMYMRTEKAWRGPQVSARHMCIKMIQST